MASITIGADSTGSALVCAGSTGSALASAGSTGSALAGAASIASISISEGRGAHWTVFTVMGRGTECFMGRDGGGGNGSACSVTGKSGTGSVSTGAFRGRRSMMLTLDQLSSSTVVSLLPSGKSGELKRQIDFIPETSEGGRRNIDWDW